jgi:hypothetical protein
MFLFCSGTEEKEDMPRTQDKISDQNSPDSPSIGNLI